MNNNLVCWKCGASIAGLAMPLARQATCRQCKTQLHVCKQCRFFDKTKSNQCQEPIAEPVNVKDKANFCELFQIKPDAFKETDGSAAAVAQKGLESLFGDNKVSGVSNNDPENAKSQLEALFGINKDNKDS